MSEEKKKRTSPKVVNAIRLEQLRPLFEVPLAQAAAKLEISETCLKRRCRRLQLQKWPYRELADVRRTISKIEQSELPPSEVDGVLAGLYEQEQLLLRCGRSDDGDDVPTSAADEDDEDGHASQSNQTDLNSTTETKPFAEETKIAKGNVYNDTSDDGGAKLASHPDASLELTATSSKAFDQEVSHYRDIQETSRSKRKRAVPNPHRALNLSERDISTTDASVIPDSVHMGGYMMPHMPSYAFIPPPNPYASLGSPWTSYHSSYYPFSGPPPTAQDIMTGYYPRPVHVPFPRCFPPSHLFLPVSRGPR